MVDGTGRKKETSILIYFWSKGVKSIRILKKAIMLIGAGDGTIDLVEEKKVQVPEAPSIAFKLPSIPSLKVVSFSEKV